MEIVDVLRYRKDGEINRQARPFAGSGCAEQVMQKVGSGGNDGRDGDIDGRLDDGHEEESLCSQR